MKERPILYKYCCATCNNIFKTPNVLKMYGFFILRSRKTDQIAYLDMTNNTIVEEFYKLYKFNDIIQQKFKSGNSDLYQTIITVCFDLAPDGSPYEIIIMPKCPACGSREMESWEATYPPEYADYDVYPVGHSNWNKLSFNEKNLLLNDAISSILKKSN